MNKYEKYYPIVSKANEKFNFFLNKAKEIKDFEQKLRVLSSLIEFAVYHNAGIWSCSYIENFYTDYAKSIDIDNYNIEYKRNSFLHVLTTGSATGGNTRVVERWINNAPEIQSHSVVFLSPNEDKMSLLENNVKFKKGKCIYFDNTLTERAKALKLRELGLKYEYIVLHTNMDDVIPVIAFGTEKFKRPVLLYNHANLLFWIGKSIADLTVDIVNNDEITSIRRNIKDTFFLGVPSLTYSISDKKELRKKLSLPLDKKIIVTSGSEKKYCIINNDSYANIIKKLIDDNTYCYIIGIQQNNKYWKNIEKQTNGHIIPLEYVKFNEGYLDYLSVADLYIDSYPMSGGTAIMDAISRGVPALALKTTDIQLDYFTSTSAYCETESEYIFKAKKILNDIDYAQKITSELQKSLDEYQSVIQWNKKVDKMLEKVPKTHSVRILTNETDFNIADDIAVLLNFMTDKNAFNCKSVLKRFIKQSYKDFVKFGINYSAIGIPYIFQLLSFKKSGLKTKVIKIFGINLFVLS